VYDDNVNISSTNRQGDVSFVIRPGLQLQLGEAAENPVSVLSGNFADNMLPFYSAVPAAKDKNYLTLDYTAAIERYVWLDQYDSDNQQVQLSTHYTFNRLTLQLASTFQDVTQNNVTAGERVHQQSNMTTFTADYRVSSKTSLELNYNQELNHYLTGGQIDSQRFKLGGTYDFHLSSKTDLFGQYNHGWDNVAQGADATYDEIDVGLNGKLTSKISGTAQVGYQRREYAGFSTTTDGVVASVNLQARLQRRTTVGLGTTRALNPSINTVNDSYWATRVDLTLNHTLPGGKTTLSLGGAYENDNYNAGALSSGREVNRWTGTAGVGYTLTKWFLLTARYQYQKNDDNQNSSSFYQNIVTLSAAVHY
jgi:hypothetical protein